ncbi:terminase [Klebsiella pneumoniae]|uniref:terminase n=1 Tax=Klebsiella pneumoniae TaxID=573 RepID=UPI002DBD9F2C|nr:terminase [Klebsiella pneumoniae]MEC4515917.1 terminase [Klebsiella pneumoniae]HBV3784366.1 terminase [Klebsiella pneumoniae]HBV5950041.1 terminase [Klebsiella pneumoniae]HCD5851372.1 terminase [Klebsiella pneumoniae]HDO6829812.1 terminase [Klebsiella pneumoniae]
MLTEKQKALLKNRFWRLNHLYKIKDKNGKCVTFKMTPEQLEYFDGMHDRNVILKARQLGFTTEVCIIQLDLAIFHKKECALIAHSLPDAERLFRNKTQFAYQRMPDDIKLANPLVKETTSEYVFAKGGSVTVSTSFRGGTLYSLHVSEFGKICAKYPEKAKEIVTGAFEAVPLGGVITLESTAEGRAGYFYDYCAEAEKAMLQGKELSNLDWKFFFFSWWKNPQYAIDPVESLPVRLIEYFAEMEAKHGVIVNERQKAWYYAKEKTLGDDMKREYPTIPAEAFQQSVEGAYYAKQFRWLYTNKRIGQIPDNSHLPVHTFWDIGVGDSTAIWFVREVGEEFHIIDYYENSGEGLRHYMKVLKDRGYEYGEHWGPHDIENREFAADAKSRKELAREGYEIDGRMYSMNFRVVPKAGIDTGIESVREILKSCVFDEEKCAVGISHLEGYRKEWDDKRGCWKDKPLHDFTSHGADGFRYFAVAKNNRKQVGTVFF